MDTSDRVSVIALVVSLVALIVTLSQALQQYFATAEGYRNCAASVIGPWHETRRRRFVWSEFRVECIYEAPLIRLLSPEELEKQKHRYGKDRVHMLCPTDGEDNSSNLVRATVHPDRSQVGKWHLQSSLQWARELVRAPKQHDDREKSALPPAQPRDEAEAEADLAEDHASLVSWIFFLRELHGTYHRYWPKDCDECKTVTGTISEKDQKPLEQTRLPPIAWNRDPGTRSDPVIVKRTIHWDFLGSGITRPVAMTTVGDIISIALRMGMQWRTIEPENGKMQAVGNGYSLSSTAASRGGIILTFAAAGDHSKLPRIVPSRAADKLLFGILPGDPYLVKKDFHMVGSDVHPRDTKAILSEISASTGMDVGVRDSDFDLGNRFLKNDFVKLLCPFFPLEGSTLATIRFAGWPRQRSWSLLHFWESRLALSQELDEEVSRRGSLDGEFDPAFLLLGQLKVHLDTLKSKYHDDFYCLKFTPSQDTNVRGNVEGRKLDFLRACRDAVDTCTDALAHRNWGELASESETDVGAVSTRYVLLVAAHSYVAKRAVEAGDKNFEAAQALLTTKKGRGASRRDWWEHVNGHETSGAASTPVVPCGSPRFWFRMKQIRLDMMDPEKGLQRELLQKFGLDVDRYEEKDAQVDVAWWLMMVRGIAWDMACYREPWPEDWKPVKSEFYGDQTHVMLA